MGNKVCFRVWGRYALFSDPITRVGGEKSSYPVPTYEALKGICESIYWKPTFIWYVDRVKVQNVIDMESKNIKTLQYNSGKNDLSIYSYLVNPSYVVEAHLEWNRNREDLACDRNYVKHLDIMERSIDKGGRRDIFLGTRECQGYVERAVFDEASTVYEGQSMVFGTMVHGITYADEADDRKTMSVRLWSPKMENGIIRFCRPEACPMAIPVRGYSAKAFKAGINLEVT